MNTSLAILFGLIGVTIVFVGNLVEDSPEEGRAI